MIVYYTNYRLYRVRQVRNVFVLERRTRITSKGPIYTRSTYGTDGDLDAAKRLARKLQRKD